MSPLDRPAGTGEFVSVGDLRLVARSGDQAPRELGGGCRRITAAAVNDRGVVAFAAQLRDARVAAAIVLTGAGPDAVLVRSGDPAPGGGRYASFDELDLGDDGCLLFRARLAGCSAAEGVFLRTASGVRVVARDGEPAPGGGRYVSFGQLALTSFELGGGPYFRLAYVARTTRARQSLVIWPSYTMPGEVLATGTAAAGGVLDGVVISRLGLALCCVAEVRDGARVRRTALLASEHQLVWGDRLRDGGELPGLGRIARLIAPPACHVHHGYVAVELAGGGTALVTRPVGTDPEVFARGGDPAPGLPGGRIRRFGPPLANSGVPGGGPCGIASVVRLDGGDTALWLGVFGHRQPMRGAAIMPLFAGDHTDDRPPLPVEAFTPLALTNTGTLLLRATVAGRPSLLVLDRLFDW